MPPHQRAGSVDFHWPFINRPMKPRFFVVSASEALRNDGGVGMLLTRQSIVICSKNKDKCALIASSRPLAFGVLGSMHHHVSPMEPCAPPGGSARHIEGAGVPGVRRRQRACCFPGFVPASSDGHVRIEGRRACAMRRRHFARRCVTAIDRRRTVSAGTNLGLRPVQRLGL